MEAKLHEESHRKVFQRNKQYYSFFKFITINPKKGKKNKEDIGSSNKRKNGINICANKYDSFHNKKNMKQNKFYFYIIILFVFFTILTKIKSGMTIIYHTYIITITIKNIGEHRIFYTGEITQTFRVNNNPLYLYINGASAEVPTKNTYYLNREENTIKLEFGPNVTELSGLFFGCENITKIDFSEFYGSRIKNMIYTFGDCFSLISIDFGNNNFPVLHQISSMFSNCKSLTSVDLSKFLGTSIEYLGHLFY